jgi:hypothetical protein
LQGFEAERRRRWLELGMRWAGAGAVALTGLASAVTAAPPLPPPELKLAFLGDQGLGSDAEAVLDLLVAEGAEALVHLGDFDYEDDPRDWEALLDEHLGRDFPVFAVVGNHDVDEFYGRHGYQERLETRMRRLGVTWEGELGVAASFEFEGVHLVQTAPGIFGDEAADYAAFIRDSFADSDLAWRVSAWHRNQTAMQTGSKTNDTGWGVYEESRRAGAIIATAHEHAYSRTHLLARVFKPSVVGSDDLLGLGRDDPLTPADEGRSFVFVSGLGGRSVRDQDQGGYWWASISTADQGARPGALFGVFHHAGNPYAALFYFKDVEGRVVDEFVVEVQPVPEPAGSALAVAALATLASLRARVRR